MLRTCYTLPDKERDENGPPRPADHAVLFQREQHRKDQERREHDELGHVEVLEERAEVDVRPSSAAVMATTSWHLE